MATIQKTTLKRYNGTDWDPVYLANSADISYIGTGFTVAEGEGFAIGDSVKATDTTATLLQKVINNLTAIDKKKIPALADGSTITSLDVSVLKGIIARTNLPEDVSGKALEVLSEDEKAKITYEQVNKGDLVKVTNGKVYAVTASTEADGVKYMELTDSASEIAWSRLADKPTTLEGYGITDAVHSNEKVTAAGAGTQGKILVLNANGKLDVDITGSAAQLEGHAAAYFATADDQKALAGRVTANEGSIKTLQSEIKAIDGSWITTGTIDIARLPATALERLYVAKDEAALKDLTTEQVQQGDTVKVEATGQMYFVVDEKKLGTTDYMKAFEKYTAATAGAVEWSNVLNKPTTLVGYGITDAINVDQKVEKASTEAVGKILTIDANGKLDTDIEGSAAQLEGHAAAYFATKTEHDAVDGRVKTAEGKITALETAVGGAESGLVKDVTDLKADNTTNKQDIANLKAGTAITALAASKLTGTVARANLPADISGRFFEKADLAEAKTSLTKETAAAGDLVKMADGSVYIIVNADNLSADEGYKKIVDVAGSSIKWSQITGTPTTVAGYGITDAVTTALLADKGTTANAGKILKVQSTGKLDTDITGDAGTLEGHAAAYFATKEAHDALAGRMDTAETDIDTLQGQIKAIDGTWITTGTIPLERLPHGALERCHVVATEEARLALTTADVQNGDTVKVTATSKMYFVVDEKKLNEEAGYEVYTAGTATSVDWSGVQNHPTTLVGYGITDAVASNEKVTVASAANKGKILVLNDAGKLDVDITGHVDWANINNAPKSTVTAIDAAVEAATHTNRATLDLLGADADGHLTYNSKAVAFKSELDQVSLGALSVVDTLPADAAEGQLVLEAVKA